MKKLLAIVLALVMVFALCACGQTAAPAATAAADVSAAPDASGANPVVKIGVFEPASGDSGAGGKKEMLGMQYANAITPTVDIQNHPALADVPADWPHFLGYNRTLFREEAQVVMRIGPDPFLAFMEHGKGRAGAFTSDCAPHWGPPEFVNWAGYTPLFKGILRYLTREAG